MGKYKNIGFPSPLNPHVGSGDFDENRVGVGHPTWVDPLVDLSLGGVITGEILHISHFFITPCFYKNPSAEVSKATFPLFGTEAPF